jgi:hypothetical protein
VACLFAEVSSSLLSSCPLLSWEYRVRVLQILSSIFPFPRYTLLRCKLPAAELTDELSGVMICQVFSADLYLPVREIWDCSSSGFRSLSLVGKLLVARTHSSTVCVLPRSAIQRRLIVLITSLTSSRLQVIGTTFNSVFIFFNITIGENVFVA